MATKEASTQQAIKFLDTITTKPDLQKQLAAASDWPAARKLASDAGFDLSGLNEADAKAIVSQHVPRGRELSANDMASVAGGASAPAQTTPSQNAPSTPGSAYQAPYVPSIPGW